MRRLIVCNIISLDGFYEGPDKDVMALPFDETFDDYNASLLRTAGLLLYGRTTFEQARGYWPSVAHSQDVRPVEREISALLDRIEKIVVSDTLPDDEVAPWENTTVLKRAHSTTRISELRRKDGGDILVFGSRTLWNHLLLVGLVDELHLLIGPALLGRGTPVFQGDSRISLRLLESRVLDGSQLILGRYAVKT